MGLGLGLTRLGLSKPTTSSGFAPRPLYSRMVWWGDGTQSVAAAAGLFNAPDHFLRLVSGRLIPGPAWNQSASGGTLDTTFARIDEVLNQVPDVCIFGSQGHNDGIYSSGYAAQMVKWERNLDDLVDGLPTTSFIVVCTKIPSSNASETSAGDWRTTVGDLMLAKVTALQDIHGERIQPCDLRGFDYATMTQDGVHPNELGGKYIADAVFAVVDPYVESASIDTILNDVAAKSWRGANVHPDNLLAGTGGTKSGTVTPTGSVATGQRVTNNLTNGTSVAVVVSKIAGSGFDDQSCAISGTPASENTVIQDDTGSFSWAAGSAPGTLWMWRCGVVIDDGAGGAPSQLVNYGLTGSSTGVFGGTGTIAVASGGYAYPIDTIVSCIAVGQGSDTIIANPQIGARFKAAAISSTRFKISRPAIFQVELEEYGPMRYIGGDGISSGGNTFRITGTGVSGSNITAATVGTIRLDPGRWAGGYASWASTSPFTRKIYENTGGGFVEISGAFGSGWTYNLAGRSPIAGWQYRFEVTGTNGIGGETQTLNFTVI